MTKVCFKCQRELPVDEFYRHPAMADGRLGKCKECAKRDVRKNRAAKREQYAKYEKARQQTLWRRILQNRYNRRRIRRQPEKARARFAVNNALRDGRLERRPCEVCGTTEKVQAHHTDYSRPLDVQWLCFKHHCEVHGKEAAA